MWGDMGRAAGAAADSRDSRDSREAAEIAVWTGSWRPYRRDGSVLMLWANECRRPSPGRDRAEMSRSEPRSRRDLGPLSTWSRYGEILGDLGRSGEIALSTWSGMTLETSPPWIIVTLQTACRGEPR